MCDGSKMVYNQPGTYSLVIPAGVLSMNMKLWGAGGAGGSANPTSKPNSEAFSGGSGGFVSCTMNVIAGRTVYLLVGQGGLVPQSYGASSGSAIGGGGLLHNDSRIFNTSHQN